MLLLAAVLWLDGWRRVPREALVLRKTGFGGWHVAEPWARLGAFALVALWPPLIVPLLVPTADDAEADAPAWRRDFTIAVARGRRRLDRTRVQMGALRAIGVLLIAWIVVGIPLATARSGLNGLLLGILGAFCLSTWLAVVVAGTARELGSSWRAALRVSAPVISPFTAVRAPEAVIDAALGGLPALARVAVLLGNERFVAWLRSHAYDVTHPDATPHATDALGEGILRLPRRILDLALAAPAAEAADTPESRYCPRCARSYLTGAGACADCPGIALIDFPERQITER